MLVVTLLIVNYRLCGNFILLKAKVFCCFVWWGGSSTHVVMTSVKQEISSKMHVSYIFFLVVVFVI